MISLATAGPMRRHSELRVAGRFYRTRRVAIHQLLTGEGLDQSGESSIAILRQPLVAHHASVAIASVNRAMGLNSHCPEWYFIAIRMLLISAYEYNEAIRAAKQIVNSTWL
jgi:hypothetical protein